MNNALADYHRKAKELVNQNATFEEKVQKQVETSRIIYPIVEKYLKASSLGEKIELYEYGNMKNYN